jgi:hypothetical protein
MPFDPRIEKEAFLHADRALLRQLLDTEFKTYRPMGYLASTVLHKLVYCWLVGLHEEIAPVLPRVIGWLDHAIAVRAAAGDATREAGGDVSAEATEPGDDPPPGLRTNLHATRAMARWLHRGDAACDGWHASLARGERRTTPGQIALDDYLAWCVQAGDHTTGIALIESQLALRASAPAHAVLTRLPRPREFAYAICLHHVRGRFEPAELFEAGKRMLGGCLDEAWLSTGESLRAAMWLKIVYADLAAPLDLAAASPLDAVRHAHDHLAAASALTGRTIATPRSRLLASTRRASGSR